MRLSKDDLILLNIRKKQLSKYPKKVLLAEVAKIEGMEEIHNMQIIKIKFYKNDLIDVLVLMELKATKDYWSKISKK